MYMCCSRFLGDLCGIAAMLLTLEVCRVRAITLDAVTIKATAWSTYAQITRNSGAFVCSKIHVLGMIGIGLGV